MDTATKDKPSFIRLLVQIELSKENAKVVNDLATHIETKIRNVPGFKLIKVASETVHAVETYGSIAPPLPHPVRRAAGPPCDNCGAPTVKAGEDNVCTQRCR